MFEFGHNLLAALYCEPASPALGNDTPHSGVNKLACADPCPGPNIGAQAPIYREGHKNRANGGSVFCSFDML